jgi:membrane-bound lytic murein transglycosylase B
MVIKAFNNSDAYALAIGLLSDRLRGAGPLRAAWPADDYQPSRGERVALQRRLVALGFRIADLDGHLDFDLRDAVREMQRRFGMTADGYPGRVFLRRLGITAR